MDAKGWQLRFLGQVPAELDDDDFRAGDGVWALDWGLCPMCGEGYEESGAIGTYSCDSPVASVFYPVCRGCVESGPLATAAGAQAVENRIEPLLRAAVGIELDS